MDVLLLARLQFAITIVYHFSLFRLPWVYPRGCISRNLICRHWKEKYKRLTKFWGKLFLINFAIVLSQASCRNSNSVCLGRSTPVLWETYLARHWQLKHCSLSSIESTFLGIWIFGWDKLSKGLHLTAIWLVAIASSISALWILIANMFMQHPVGYAVVDGRAVLTDFYAVITNYPFSATTHTS